MPKLLKYTQLFWGGEAAGTVKEDLENEWDEHGQKGIVDRVARAQAVDHAELRTLHVQRG